MTVLEERKKKMKQRILINRIIVGSAALALLIVAVVGIRFLFGHGDDFIEASTTPGMVLGEDTEASVEEQELESVMSPEEQRVDLITQANWLAAGYDYDGAIALIQTWEGYETEAEMTEAIAGYEAAKATLVPTSPMEVTHIFYHSLIVDPEKAFANHETDHLIQGVNQWMTTIDEFNKITQEMYDRGFVMVSIHDLFEVGTDEAGNEIFIPKDIMLPPGKKPFVLSLDDLNYYHSYEPYGMASKLVIDENGIVTNEYIQRDGTMVHGAYDVVPLMDQFVAEHPDAAYRGAKGIIALTGYNGILGYRTDESYTQGWPDLNWDKQAFLDQNPDFDLEAERAEAKRVAEAMKADGWQFASHSWGHIRMDSRTLDVIKRDNDRWMRNVGELVGPVDTLIFAHGADIQSGNNQYDRSDPKFQFLMDQGFRIFAGVDSAQFWVRFGEDYMRMARRNLDGYRIYFNATGVMDNLSDLFDAAAILDPKRPPVRPL